MSAALDNPIFTDADKAREHLEAQRWPIRMSSAVKRTITWH